MARIKWTGKSLLQIHTKVRGIIRAKMSDSNLDRHAEALNTDREIPGTDQDLHMSKAEMEVFLSDHMAIQSLALQMQRTVPRCLWDCIDSMVSPEREDFLDNATSHIWHDLRVCAVCNMCDEGNKQRSQEVPGTIGEGGLQDDAADPMGGVISVNHRIREKQGSLNKDNGVRTSDLDEHSAELGDMTTSPTSSRLSTPPSTIIPPSALHSSTPDPTLNQSQSQASPAATSIPAVQTSRKRKTAATDRGMFEYGDGKKVAIPPGRVKTNEPEVERSLLPWDPEKLAKTARKSGSVADDQIVWDDGKVRKRTRFGKK